MIPSLSSPCQTDSDLMGFKLAYTRGGAGERLSTHTQPRAYVYTLSRCIKVDRKQASCVPAFTASTLLQESSNAQKDRKIP